MFMWPASVVVRATWGAQCLGRDRDRGTDGPGSGRRVLWGKEAGCREPGSFLEEVASAEDWWSFLSPFKKKKNAFLLYKGSIQIVLKGAKQKPGVALLQSGCHQYTVRASRSHSVLTHWRAELPQHKRHRPCGEPGFSEKTRGSLDWIFRREPMAVGGWGVEVKVH